MPGRDSSQSGTQLPGVSPQNGNVVPNIVAAGSGAPHAWFGTDADLLRARTDMQEKIFVLLAQRHHQRMNDSQIQKLKDIVKRLEEGLFKTAPSKEEYLNMSTLEFRLHSLIKRPSLNNRNPVNPNSMPTMIPTPGLSHNGSSTMTATSSVDAQMSNMVGSSSMQPTNSNTGNLMSSGVMQSSSFNRTDGLLSNGYQQAQANYPIGSGGNNPVTDGCAKNEQPDDSDSRI